MSSFGFLTSMVVPVSSHFTSSDFLFGGTVCLICSSIRPLICETMKTRTVHLILFLSSLNESLATRLAK
jgi:hypothetical protein